MSRLSSRLNNVVKKQPKMERIRYYVTQYQDPEAYALAYQAEIEDPVFCKHVVDLVNHGIKLLNRLEKELGYEPSYDYGVMVCPELQDNQDTLKDLVESRIQRPLYVDAIPDWSTNLAEDGLPFETALCYPESRHDYWQTKKLEEYDRK